VTSCEPAVAGRLQGWFAGPVSLDALRTAYADLTAVAVSLDEDASWRPTGCQGWTVRDLIHHLLGDAQRALVALGTPAEGPADTDAITYWRHAPTGPDPESRSLRAARTMASQWRLPNLTGSYAETAGAVVISAGRAPLGELVRTQGHVLSVQDLLNTLVVEATIHHLDILVGLDVPGPRPALLALTRTTLDGLLERTTPQDWDDAQWVRASTGRVEPTEQQTLFLGDDVDRLPLLG
jgi:uncharacterized protein (TIGR03083 family)